MPEPAALGAGHPPAPGCPLHPDSVCSSEVATGPGHRQEPLTTARSGWREEGLAPSPPALPNHPTLTHSPSANAACSCHSFSLPHPLPVPRGWSGGGGGYLRTAAAVQVSVGQPRPPEAPPGSGSCMCSGCGCVSSGGALSGGGTGDEAGRGQAPFPGGTA